VDVLVVRSDDAGRLRGLVQPVRLAAVTTATRRSDAVHDRLRGAILAGSLAPGDPLPSERTLSAEEGVNRHAVREAVKRLQQAGLVEVAQGGATRVLDWRAHGGLELLADLSAGVAPGELLRSVVEMRLTVGGDAARRCAERATPTARRELLAVAARAGEGATYDERLTAYEALWEHIVAHSGNVAFRLAFNSLVRARHGAGIDASIYTAEVEDPAAIRRLAEAVAAGDGAVARDVAVALLARSEAPG
jgi:GntR family transcriptional regulator, transcriptional repressor for pyruvate dehydrogenase complex